MTNNQILQENSFWVYYIDNEFNFGHSLILNDPLIACPGNTISRGLCLILCCWHLPANQLVLTFCCMITLISLNWDANKNIADRKGQISNLPPDLSHWQRAYCPHSHMQQLTKKIHTHINAQLKVKMHSHVSKWDLYTEISIIKFSTANYNMPGLASYIFFENNITVFSVQYTKSPDTTCEAKISCGGRITKTFGA